MSATTDSEMIVKFDKESKPGISNLINIYSSLTGKDIEAIEKEFENSNYGDFKKKVADVVVEEIKRIQDKYYYYLNSEKLDIILDEGIKKARKIAKEKYDLVKNNINISR